MRSLFMRSYLVVVCLFMAVSARAQMQDVQTSSTTEQMSVVPRLIKFGGTLLDVQDHPMKGPVGVTFALYAQQSEGAALWLETQNVRPDEKGNYTVLLGAKSANGAPAELFTSGEARWLGVEVEQQPEQPRVLLVSVPYALKAGDAQTLGGLPPSAFAPAVSRGGPSGAASSSGSLLLPVGAISATSLNGSTDPNVTTGGGTVNFVPKFDTSTDVKISQIFDNGANVGIGFPATPTPIAKLDVNGSANIRGALTVPAINTATSSTKGFNSQPFDFVASVFNGTAAVNQHFRWQAEPVNPGLSTASGKLNLLFASGTGAPAETGLSINNKGLITFASGQTLPTITGNETVTGNVSANQLQSNVATGTAPFVVKSTTQVANLNASFLGGMPAGSFATRGANSFSGFQSIAGNGLSMYIGDVACPAGSVGIQAQVFSFGCSNFAMLLDSSGNTIINRPTGGKISFREGNGADQLVIAPAGSLAGRAGGILDVVASGDGFDALHAQASDSSEVGGVGLVGTGGSATAAGALSGQGLQAFGGAGKVAGSSGGTGVLALGGSATSGGGGSGGFGIEASGGLNSDGSRARAGEFHGDVEITGCLGINGLANQGSCQSDVRLKKNIRPYLPVLDKLVRLQPVTYDWRVEEYPQFRFSAQRATGLVAQEVEKVFPDMVSTDQAGYKRVNYGELPYLMLQAIRELKAENEKLQEELNTKQAQWEERFRAQEERASFKEMQQQMAALEARLTRVESGGGSNQTSTATRKAHRDGGRLEAGAWEPGSGAH